MSLDNFCSNCGQGNKFGSLYCEHCGRQLIFDENLERKNVNELLEGKWKSYKLTFWLSMGILHSFFIFSSLTIFFGDMRLAILSTTMAGFTIFIPLVLFILFFKALRNYQLHEKYLKLKDEKRRLRYEIDMKHLHKGKLKKPRKNIKEALVKFEHLEGRLNKLLKEDLNHNFLH